MGVFLGIFRSDLSLEVPIKSRNMSEGTLRVIDGRTGLSYDIPIVRNAVEATSFRQIKAPLNQSNFVDEVSGGIRVVDEGLQNTAVRRSAITYL